VTDDPQGVSKRTDGSAIGAGDDTPIDANRIRPVGMLPRGMAQREASEENRQHVLDLAEALFPGVDHIDHLGLTDRRFWIHTANLFLRDDLVDPLFARFSEAFAPAVDAEVDDILARREFDFENERRRTDRDAQERDEKKRRRNQRHQEACQERAQDREIARERWDVERQEWQTHLRNGSLREMIVLGMAVAGFLLVFAICIVGLLNESVVVAGGSAGSLLAIAVGVVFQQIRQDQKQGLAVLASIRRPRPEGSPEL